MSTSGIRVAALGDIPVGDGIAIDKSITGTTDDIALLRDDDGTVYALNNTCPHEIASLARGHYRLHRLVSQRLIGERCCRGA
ncbi:Rieske (2Fe-2S) protein [Nocardia xishanensis]